MTDSLKRNTNEILKKAGFRFKKKWGQNFIFDKNLLIKIAEAGEIVPGDTVVEIGPGAGTLTRVMADQGARILTIEIDDDLIPILEENLKGYDVQIKKADVLKVDIDALIEECRLKKPYKVVANLPYYITTPIIMQILESKCHFTKMVIMVQWEVAKRLTALPGTKDYGALTLAVNYYTQAKVLFKVPRHLFSPKPDVDSAIVVMEKHKKQPVNVYNTQIMFKIIKAAFGQRRKTLQNALTSVDNEVKKEEIGEILDNANIDKARRGETLSLDEYAHLANTWHAYTSSIQ